MVNEQSRLPLKAAMVAFDGFLRELKHVGTPAEVAEVEGWRRKLCRDPSPDDIYEVWERVRDLGNHMGYMDYGGEPYDLALDRLKDEVRNVVLALRSRP